MHILIISEIFPPDMAGSSTRAHNVAKGLLAKGVKVTVLAGFPHYPTGNVPQEYRKKAFVQEYVDDIRVIRTYVPPLESKGFLKRAILFAAFVVSSIFPFVLVGRVDGVFASNPQIISAYPALVYKMLHRCPVVLNVDDLWPENLYDLGMLKSKNSRRVGEFVARLAYRKADAITPISPAYVETIVDKYSVPGDKVIVVPGGVDLSIFSSRESQAHRRGVFTIMYIGAFSPAYDFDQVLEAAKLFEREDIEIVLRGGGETAPLVRDRIRELDVRNVELVQSIVSREEVARIMAGVDLLLLPLNGTENVEKGISTKLYEYQAVGKPIICCSRGMPGRYVAETKSGIVVKPGDYEGLAEAIMYVYHNREIAKELGENGRRYVEENLSLQQIISKLISVFKAAGSSRLMRTVDV
ncbi:glycosyltransferase family 4 protein [Candidatus Bathyarchaeota archaeon]|nr:glycosyltransferase family 4 protein [Candidatus Bathyarchaeota archaeon]